MGHWTENFNLVLQEALFSEWNTWGLTGRMLDSPVLLELQQQWPLGYLGVQGGQLDLGHQGDLESQGDPGEKQTKLVKIFKTTISWFCSVVRLYLSGQITQNTENKLH